MTVDLKIPGFAINSRKKYLGEDSEIGLSALACYQFDGSGSQLNDRTSGGYNLTLENGTAKVGSIGGKPGFWFDGSTNLLAPDTEDLRIVDALTLEFVAKLTIQSSTGIPMQCAASGTGLVNNALYSINFNTDETLLYGHKYGAGSTWIDTSMDMHPLEETYYLAITRSSDGLTIKFYVNGVLVNTGTLSNASEKDASGNLQRLTIGTNENRNAYLKDSIVSSIRMSNSELTATQIANVYDQIW